MSAPVAVRDAATVVLLRDGDPAAGTGIEAWLLTRVAAMAFAAGMSVFPGGRIEPGDAQLPMAGTDRAATLTALAERLDCSVTDAAAALGAAVRETFEETGVLLAIPDPSGSDGAGAGSGSAGPDRPAAAVLAEARTAVEAGRLDFGALLAEHRLAIDTTALRPWARWVTPVGEVRRYDTRFFVGALPPGAVADDVTTESSAAAWVPVALALEQAQRGERRLMPPTLVTLTALSAYPDVAAVLAASLDRSLAPVCPVLRIREDGSATVTLPDGAVHAIPRSLLA